MATGSRKWVIYTDDNGTDYGVIKDESIAADTGFLDVTAANQAGLPTLPTYFRMRYLNCVRKSGGQTIRTKFQIGAKDTFDDLVAVGVIVVDGTTWQISSPNGESFRTPVALDTEQDDGTDA